jgi:uncharacterized protein (TIGR02186 family)
MRRAAGIFTTMARMLPRSLGAFLAALVAAVAIGVPSAALAEKLTIAVSTPEVRIDSSFTGIPITVFGVVGQDAASLRHNDYKVAVVVLGPPESVVVRRADRVVGIWANRAAQTIIRPPSFYGLNTSGPLSDLASPAVLDRLQLGFDDIAFAYGDRALINDPQAKEFRDAFIRLKERAGLFYQQVGVTFIGDLVFRATAFLPANVPVGSYSVLVYLFESGDLVASAQETIEVSKSGLEGTISVFAHSQALAYGLIVVALALFIGWLGGVIFRRD